MQFPITETACLWQPAWFLNSNVNVHHWARWQQKAAGTLDGGGNAPSSTGGLFPVLFIPAASVHCELQPRHRWAADSRAKASSSGWQAKQCPCCGANERRAATAGEPGSGTSWVRLTGLGLSGSKPALPPDAQQWCGSKMSPNPNRLVDGFSA